MNFVYSECLLVTVSPGSRDSGQSGVFSLDMTDINKGETWGAV